MAKVKAEWGSIKGLVGRFKSLGVISAARAESLYKQISARRWTKVGFVDWTETPMSFGSRIALPG